MSTDRRAIWLLTPLLMLLLSSWGGAMDPLSPAQAAGGERHLYTFSDGSSEAVALIQGGIADTSLKVALPRGAEVTNASVTLAGASATGWSQISATNQNHWMAGAPSAMDARSDELTLGFASPTTMLDTHGSDSADGSGQTWVDNRTFSIRQPHTSDRTETRFQSQTITTHTIGTYTGAVISYRGWYFASRWDSTNLQQTVKKLYINNASVAGSVRIDEASCSIPNAGNAAYGIRDMTVTEDERVFAILANKRRTTASINHRVVEFDVRYPDVWRCVNAYDVATNTWGDYVAISYDRLGDLLYIFHSSQNTVVAYTFNSDGTFERDTSHAYSWTPPYSGVTVNGMAVHGSNFHFRRTPHSSEGSTYYNSMLQSYAVVGASHTLSDQGDSTKVSCPGYGMHYDGKRLISLDSSEGGYCNPTYVREFGSAIRYEISPQPGTTSWTSAPIVMGSDVLAVNMETSWSFTSAGDRVDYFVSADNGTHWEAVTSNETIHFAHPDTELRWKLTLVGASAISWWVSIEAATAYSMAGEWTSPIHPTGSFVGRLRPSWTATEPSGTTLDVQVSNNNGSDWSDATSGQLIELQEDGNQLLYRVSMTTSDTALTPTLHTFVLEYEEGYPKDVRLDINDDSDAQNPDEWRGSGLLNEPVVVSNQDMVDALNEAVPENGLGTVDIVLTVGASSPGRVRLTALDITYRLRTRVLDASLDGSMLVPDGNHRVLVVRAAVGDQANDIRRVEVEFENSHGPNPRVRWDSGDSCTTLDDGGGLLGFDAENCTSLYDSTNDIVSVRLPVRSTWAWDDEVDLQALVSVGDGGGVAVLGWRTEDLDLRVENDIQLTQMMVTEETGRQLTSQDWMRGGFNITFEGSLAFQDTSIPPPAGLFNLTVTGRNLTRGGEPMEDSRELHRERNPAHGHYRMTFTSPVESSPGGMLFSVTATDMANGSLFANPGFNTIRLILDGNSPLVLMTDPADGTEVHKGAPSQAITISVQDSVDPPTHLTLSYWVQHDHDSNFNGLPEENEYLATSIANPDIQPGGLNVFSGIIQDGNVGHLTPEQVHGNRISYYVTGEDQQGNDVVMGGEPVCPQAPPSCGDGPGMVPPDWSLDLADYRLREEFLPELDRLNSTIIGHDDDAFLHPGISYEAKMRVADRNGWQDLTTVTVAMSGDPDDDEALITATIVGDEVTYASSGPTLAVSNLYSRHEVLNDTAIDLFIRFQLTWEFPRTFDHAQAPYSPRVIIGDQPCRTGELTPCHTVDNEYLGNDTWTLKKDLQIDTDPGHFTAIELTTGRDVFDRGGLESLVGAGQVIRIGGRVVFSNSTTPAPPGAVAVAIGDVEREWRTSPGAGGHFSMDILVPFVRSGHLDLFTRLEAVPADARDNTTVTPRLRLAVDGTSPTIDEISPSGAVALETVASVPLRLQTSDASGFSADDPPVLHYAVRAGTSEVSRGSFQLTLAQQGKTWLWNGDLDLTDGGAKGMLPGYTIAMWVTGSDAVGNPYPAENNTEREPLAIWVLERDGPWVDMDSATFDWSDAAPIEQRNVSLMVAVTNGASTSGTLRFVLEREFASVWMPVAEAEHLFGPQQATTIELATLVPEWRESKAVYYRLLVLDGDIELNRTSVDPLLVKPDEPATVGAAVANALESQQGMIMWAFVAIAAGGAFAFSMVRGNKWRQRVLEGDHEGGEELPPPAPPDASLLARALDQTAMVMADHGGELPAPPPPAHLVGGADASRTASNGWTAGQIRGYYEEHGVDMDGWDEDRVIDYYEGAAASHTSGVGGI